MPDLRISVGETALSVQNGQIDTSKVGKAEAEKLIAKISASLINSKGTARSGYLQVHVEGDGSLRFMTGHWSRDAKAKAAKLMLDLAKTAWGTQSVDTQALEKYLSDPDQTGRNIAERARQAGTRSLLKLVSNRHDAYNSTDHAYTRNETGEAQGEAGVRLLFEERREKSVSQLQTYANRYLAPTRARLRVGDPSGRAKEISDLVTNREQAIAAEKTRIAEKARGRIAQLVDKQVTQRRVAFALNNDIELSDQNREDIEQQRLNAVRTLESRVLGGEKSVEHRLLGLYVRPKKQGEQFDLSNAAERAGLPVCGWRPKDFWNGDTSSAETRVLSSGYEQALKERFEGSELEKRATALGAMQTAYRQDVLALSDQIKGLADAYRKECGEAAPDPAIPTSFGESTTAGIALAKILSFVNEHGIFRPLTEKSQEVPRPLDYALIGVSGVDGLNFGAINQTLIGLSEDLKRGHPHPAELIQDVVNGFNQRVMGRGAG
jgi:hypothetical protein